MTMKFITLENAAKTLAEYNAEAEPNIQAIYLFPQPQDKPEIRLVAVDSSALPGNEIIPFYFEAEPDSGIPYPFAIALIPPEDQNLPLPEGWGAWDEAHLIWQRR